MTPKPLPKGLISRITSGIRYMITGDGPDDWFGPGQPLQPVAQQVKGRTWDFDVATNLNYTPRGEEGISFDQLRALADNYDILRLAIETRKDQIGSLSWDLQVRSGEIFPVEKIKEIKKSLNYPDKENTFHTWSRLIMEDSLVIDAATIYPRRTRGGKLYALEVVDGATIKPLIDTTGRRPLPPSPAYQQVLHGVPAVDYTVDELIYCKYNPRTNHLYGMSPVEQIILLINIALRRETSVLQFYTEGTVPEALIGVPQTWSPEEIREFQRLMDQYMAGDTARRRRMTFVPGGMDYHPTKEAQLKDEMDEWLARVVCFAFSIPPTALTRQVNRSTAEEAQATALQEGLAPRKQWFKGLMNFILEKYFDAPELDFVWGIGEQEQDPMTKAQIQTLYIKAGVLTVDEVRAELGRNPQAIINGGLNEEGTTANPPPDQGGHGSAPGVRPSGNGDAGQNGGDSGL